LWRYFFKLSDMKPKSLLLKLLFVIILSGCSTSRFSNSAGELLSDEFATGNSGLTVRIPRGWFQAYDNEKNVLDLWIVSGDYSASIQFKTINFFDEVNNLHEAVKISKAVNKISDGNKRQFLDENKNIDGSAAYKIIDDGSVVARVVVFPWKGKFYECTAGFLPDYSGAGKEKVFELQDEVLKNLKY